MKRATTSPLALASKTEMTTVVEPAPAPPPAARNRSGRGETKSCRIELEVDGVILRVRSDIDEAQLTGTIRAIRAASR